MCIVGPSGCGKTTLLRVISGLEKSDTGIVLVDGKKSTSPDSSKGMIFQELNLFPWRTVRKNVEFGLEYSNTPPDDRKKISDYYLQLVNLEEWADRYPHELSGGMKQRVAIARALALDPHTLLMDEPFGSLDAQTRNLMQNELLTIWEKTKKTIIFVTHNIDESVFLSDRVIILSSRPATVKKILEIKLKRPRERTSAKFQNHRKKILREIALVRKYKE